MFLINGKLRGNELPQQLPPSLLQQVKKQGQLGTPRSPRSPRGTANGDSLTRSNLQDIQKPTYRGHARKASISKLRMVQVYTYPLFLF